MSNELGLRRKTAGITGVMLSKRAGIQRTKLSDIERGYVEIGQKEMDRIEDGLNELIAAKKRVQSVARECGWPVTAV